MTISMSNLICVTNRSLCKEDFLTRIDRLAQMHPTAILLREKDLSEQEYTILAAKVLEICKTYGTTCILHNYPSAAAALDHTALHLPLPVLRTLTASDRAHFQILGASCHSASDAIEAQALGCSYLTAGHIFDTDCKKGLAGRGIPFLRNVCASVSIPVYAIGGIQASHLPQIQSAGAAGACIMSSAMTCEDVSEYLSTFSCNKENTNDIS